MKRYKVTFIYIVVLIALIFLLSQCEDGETDADIGEVSVRAFVFPDGDLYIEELYDYTIATEPLEGLTRHIDSGSHDGIEFFEAYQLDELKDIKSITTDDIVPIPFEYEKEEDVEEVFYMDQQWNEGSARILYRYRLDNVVKKYQDVAELNWSFFEYDSFDHIAEVPIISLDVILPDGVLETEVDSYVHPFAGATMERDSDNVYHYSFDNKDNYLAYIQLQLLLPSTYMTELAIAEDIDRRSDVLASQERETMRFENRSTYYNVAVVIVMLFCFVCIFSMIYIKFLSPNAQAIRQGKWLNADELENLNPLFIALVHHDGKFKPEHIISALFSLYQRKLVTIEKAANTLRFVISKNSVHELTDHERFLIDWLFVKGDKETLYFSTELLDKQTDQEVTDPNNIDKAVHFWEMFLQWSEKAATEVPVQIEKLSYLSKLIGSLLIFHALLLTYFAYINLYDFVDIAIMLGIFSVCGFITFCYENKHAHAIFFILTAIFLAVSIEDGFIIYLPATIVTILLTSSLPKKSASLEVARYVVAIDKWKIKLASRKYPMHNQQDQDEMLFIYALILDVARPFSRNLEGNRRFVNEDKEHLLIDEPIETIEIFQQMCQKLTNHQF